jgi:DNA (cytosine-5)-methyltransferase 1
VLPAKTKNKVEVKRRQEQGILQISAAFEPGSHQADNPGFPHGAPYATPPQNRYQKWLRQELDEDELVTGHYTRRYAAHVVET